MVMVERSYSREEREERWTKKQAYLLRIQKTAGTTFPTPAAAAAAEKTATAISPPFPLPPLPPPPSLHLRPLLHQLPLSCPPADANDDTASDITYASLGDITTTILHKEDPSFPENQLDDRFALIGDGSWEADASAEFPEVGGAAVKDTVGERRVKPSYPAAEEGILAQMLVTETSEELRAGFEESMRRVRARGVEEEEDERRETEEKAKVARWRAEEWEREKKAEAERLAEARRKRAEETERGALAQKEWEEERERSAEDERRRDEAAETAEREGDDVAERVADSAETGGAGVHGIQVSPPMILCMTRSPKRDAPCTTLPRGGKPAAPQTPAGSSSDETTSDGVDHQPAAPATADAAKWRRVEETKRRKRAAETAAKVSDRSRGGGNAGAPTGKLKPVGGRTSSPMPPPIKMSALLTIASYNINRSPLVLDVLLSSPSLSDYDALLLQEPPAASPPTPSRKGGPSSSPPPTTLRSPTMTGPAWQFSSPHLPALRRPPTTGPLARPCRRRAAGERGGRNRTLASVLPPLLPTFSPSVPLLLAGDFNLRHPAWDPLLLNPPSYEAENARLTFEDAGLLLLRPPGEPTFFSAAGEVATLDLAVGNLHAEEKLVSAYIDEALESGSDHRPLRISLLLDKSPSPPPPRRRLHRKGNKPDRLAAYNAALSSPPPSSLATAEDIEEEATHLTLALQAAAETAPLSTPPATLVSPTHGGTTRSPSPARRRGGHGTA
ncbi:hypothetical protein JCM11251_003435 [Rhodosporidiobolus azoricus]